MSTWCQRSAHVKKTRSLPEKRPLSKANALIEALNERAAPHARRKEETTWGVQELYGHWPLANESNPRHGAQPPSYLQEQSHWAPPVESSHAPPPGKSAHLWICADRLIIVL